MSSRLADRLSAARRRHFVGRAAERDLFRTALDAPDLPFLLLYVSGPGGVGKSALVREFEAIARETGVPAYYLDGRNAEPTPDGFLALLRFILGIGPDENPAAAFASRPDRHLLLIDTFELLAPLDSWLRDYFLPQLPENVLVVLAGRNAPSPGWRADPGWQTLVRVAPLRNLSPDESRLYLEQRNVPADQANAVLNFTHGHPIALSLVAETFAQREAVTFQPDVAPDIIKTLVEQFIQKVPGPAHRAALEACAQVRLMSEPLLDEMLNLPDPHDLFDWLRGLSFIESGPQGLFPHDLAREALVADLRWRHPDWYKELHRRARHAYTIRLGAGRREEQQRLLFDLVYLHRDNPAVRPFFEWAHAGTLLPDSLRDTDKAAILAMVTRHEGAASAHFATYWLARQPEGFLVFRDPQQRAIGFINMVALERTSAEDRQIDPAIAAALNYLEQHAPLRTNERATLFRFWMAEDTYQAVSPAQSLAFVQAVNHYLTTPGLAFSFFPCADAAFWAPVFAFAELVRLPAADFAVDGRSYGMYCHDWRVMPQATWLAVLGERDLSANVQAAAVMPSTEQVVVLSHSDFASALRDALRDCVRPDALRNNPLIRSRLVLERAGPSTSVAERTGALQALIREAAETLQASPRDAKLYRALYHTYLQPAPTQERAAEILDLPFSTYRRHLMTAIAQVTDALWNREIGG